MTLSRLHPTHRWATVLVGSVLALLAVHCGASADSSLWSGAGGTGTDAGTAGSTGFGGSGGSLDASTCTVAGEFVCVNGASYTCGADGQLYGQVLCGEAGTPPVCADKLGCVTCVPGATSCADGTGTICTSTGDQVVSFECDPKQGMQCLPDGCLGACTPDKLSKNHVGCDFWPTVTANSVWRKWFSFGVAVANTTDEPANIVVTRGEETILERPLDASSFEVIELPWIDELKGADAELDGEVFGPSASVLSSSSEGGGAYRLRTDRPVTVVQYNTLQAANPEGIVDGCPAESKTGSCLSYSNDASLLVPTSSLGLSYRLLGWHSWFLDEASGGLAMGDLLAVTAPYADTTVKVKAQSPILGFVGDEPTTPGEELQFILAQGDVLELFTDGVSAAHQWAGSVLEADRPVQVLTGVPCVNIPSDAPACDHVEEWIPPEEMLGKRYLVVSPITPAGRLRQMLRVHGTTDETVISFDPSTVHKPVTVGAGESVEVDLSPESNINGLEADVLVSSDKPFGLTQYMLGHTAAPVDPESQDANLGDPSQTVAIPVSRYLKSYVIVIPPGFDTTRVSVVAPTGSQVFLDDEALPDASFQAVGATGFSVTRIDTLEPGSRHEIRGEQPVGVTVYGFGRFTSFMYPAGMDLRPPTSS